MAISLQKITLDKKGDTHVIDLSKKDSLVKQEITINLNWSKGNKKGLFASLFRSDIDLDLGCFYELTDGSKNVIDGLQFSNGNGGTRNTLSRQGRYVDSPWVWHTGDDRGASSGSGENIIVNPDGIRFLKRMIIYCFIYEGAAKWQETNAVVTIKVPGSTEIEVEMGHQTSSNKFCAIAEILFTPNSIGVKKLVSFHTSHQECDQAYGWRMQWTSGAK